MGGGCRGSPYPVAGTTKARRSPCTSRAASPYRVTGRALCARSPAPRLFAGLGLPTTSAAWLVRTTPAAWLASAENIRQREVVPPTTLADLDHVDPELAIFGGHLRQFWRLPYPALVAPEFVAVNVGDVRELGFPADGAAGLGGLAVELRSAQQVRVRVADIGDRGVAGQHRRERCPPGKPIIDHRPLWPHARQSTTRSPRRRDPSPAPVPGRQPPEGNGR